MAQDLAAVAKQIRIDIIEETAAAGSGHPGGSLSCADILTVLYFDKMNIDPADPKKADRDRLVLSKGHAALTQYACLCELGYFDRKWLKILPEDIIVREEYAGVCRFKMTL